MSSSVSHPAGDYGNLLRRLRLRAGMSQDDLAKRAGLSKRGLRNIEAQAVQPRAGTVRLLADALELDDEQRDAFFSAALPKPTAGPAAPTRPAAVKPAQLPPTTAAFVGRGDAVAAVETAARSRQVVVVDGMAGIGKTTLATYCARRFTDRYPDGQLFIDLHGFHADIPPMTASAALDRLLRSLGVASEQIPKELDARAALFRSVLAGRRMVIVLDNAASESQLGPLLPGDPGNLVLVTSRNKLPGLDDAAYLSLANLTETDAVDLFRRVADNEDDDGAVTEIVEHCGRLPLAIRIAASRLANRPNWTYEWMLERLKTRDGPLAELSRGHGGVTVAFELSYADLNDELVRFFRALGTGFGTDFDSHAASALAGISSAAADALLEQLLDVNLVLPTQSPGRFRFHDLIRQFAHDKACAQESRTDRETMRVRLLDQYRATAQHAANLLNPHFTPEHTPTGDVELPRLDTTVQAQQWFDAEHRNLILAVDHAVTHHDDRHAIDLALALWTYLTRTDRDAEQEHVHRRSLEAARRTGDEAAQARTLNLLGITLPKLGDSPEAMRCLERSLEIRRRIDDHRGAAATLNNLAQAVSRQGRLRKAIGLYRESTALAAETGYEALEAMAHTSLGECLVRSGDWDEAGDLIGRAIATFSRVDHSWELARARYTMARLLQAVGKPSEAYQTYTEVLDFCREHDVATPMSHVLCGMAAALRDLGELDQSLALAGQAHDMIDGHRNFAEADCLNELGHTHLAMGDPAAARDAHQRAVAVTEHIGQPEEHAMALHGLARATAALGDPAQALGLATEALAAYESIGMANAAALRRFVDELTGPLAE